MNTRQYIPQQATLVAAALARIESVRAILCFGSYATGRQDPQSDIDLFAFCQHAIPESPLRLAALQAMPSATAITTDQKTEGWDDEQWLPAGDELQLGGQKVEIGYNTLEWLNTVVQQVIKGKTSVPQLRFRPYAMLGLLDNSIILYDPDGSLSHIKEHLYPYPPALKAALIDHTQATVRDALSGLRDYVKRDIGNTAFIFNLDRAVDAMGILLFAMNEKHFLPTKRAEQAYAALPKLPVRFIERYNKMLATALTPEGRRDTAAELAQLFAEVQTMA